MPNNKPEIWDQVKPGVVKVGDYIRIATFYDGAVVIHEGEIEKIDAEWVPDSADWTGRQIFFKGIPMGQAEIDSTEGIIRTENHRRRPQVNLPTKPGSAVLVYDPMYLQESVAGLIRSDPLDRDDKTEWRYINRASVVVPEEIIERNYIRTLHDAGRA